MNISSVAAAKNISNLEENSNNNFQPKISHHKYFQPPNGKYFFYDEKGNSQERFGYEYNYHTKGWASGLWGYLYASHTERDILIVNDILLNHPSYVYRILKFNQEIAPYQLRKVIKAIKEGMACMAFPWLSILEVSAENNEFHLNVIVRCDDTEANANEIVQCLKQSASGYKHCIRTAKRKDVGDFAGLVNYCLKCKIQVKERSDIYKFKRVLLAKGKRLRKVDFSPDFYAIPKGKIRDEIRATRDTEKAAKNLASLPTWVEHVINPSRSNQKDDTKMSPKPNIKPNPNYDLIEGDDFQIYLPKNNVKSNPISYLEGRPNPNLIEGDDFQIYLPNKVQ